MFNNEKNNFFEEELKQSQALTSESESFDSTADIEAGNDTGETLIDDIENFDNGDTANAESESDNSEAITDEFENFDSTADIETGNDTGENLMDDIENLDESDTTVIEEKNNDAEALTDEAESSDNTDADKEESYDLEGLIDESENLDDTTDEAIDNLSDPMIHKEAKSLIDDTTSDNGAGIAESNDDEFQKLVDSILNSTEDDGHAVNSNDGMPVMPLTVYKMLMSAKQMRTVLTGIVTGVRMTSKGMAVEVTTQVQNHPLQVFIPTTKMGFDNNVKELINQRVRKKCQKVRSVKTIEKVLNREYYSYITSMLGATVDYVVDEAIRDLNVVVGDRATAMQYRRARFVKSEKFPVPSLRVGSKFRARILNVMAKSILVEVSGYTCVMRPKNISSLRINTKLEYTVGMTIDVEITKFDPQKGVSVVAIDVKDKSIKANLAAQYKHGDRLLAEVIEVKPITGEYYLKMPNGALGKVPYYVKDDYVKIHKGTKLYVIVTGKSNQNTTVMCKIRKVLN